MQRLNKIEWWKLACEKSPNPISFVGLDDRFIFCNKSWCQLLGYSEAELINKKWQDITKSEDIGIDQLETESIKNGLKEEYYLEKTYIKKNGTFVSVRLYVHRCPDTGSQDGYIVFADRLTSEEYEDLKSKFFDLQKIVLLLQQSSVTNEFISEQMSIMEQKLEHNKELTKLLALTEKSSVNIGDRISGSYSGNRAGRDNNLSSNNINLLLIVLVSVLITIILSGLITALFFFLK